MPATKIAKNEVFVFGPDQRILLLDHNSDGVMQLASTLADESNLDAIHLLGGEDSVLHD